MYRLSVSLMTSGGIDVEVLMQLASLPVQTVHFLMADNCFFFSPKAAKGLVLGSSIWVPLLQAL